MKKFDFVIGNPPYQEEVSNNGRQSPIYDRFMDGAYLVGDCVELITPARFLFDAGQTSKKWNQKMLTDPHFKVLCYEPNATNIFSNTDIKGGVVISIRNTKKNYGEIITFTEFNELNSILEKVKSDLKNNLGEICVRSVPYKYTDNLKEEHPELIDLMGDSFDLRTNALDKLYGKIFLLDAPNEHSYCQITGIYSKKRCTLWVKKDYVSGPKNFKFYKVLITKAWGSGKFGEPLPKTLIGIPNEGHTQSFVSIGCFKTKKEALNLEKYLKTKFCRCLLSVLKKTQDINAQKWRFVPLQDFSDKSDIDWTMPVANIDQQLFGKYGFSSEETNFIESHVKEMV